jgi:hypothetical protein
MGSQPTLLQRAARELGAGPLLDRLGIEPADWWEKQKQTAPPRNPAETRIGSMYMPAQTPVEPVGEIAAHTRYAIVLGPGFPEMPVWPQETWLLKSFEVQLSGTMLTEDPLNFPKGTEELDVILALEQNGAMVWSSSLSLPLLVVPVSEEREFTFTAAVFVDLVNGLPYRADSQLRFVVSGLAPSFRLTPEPLDRFETESLERFDLERVATEEGTAATEAGRVATEEGRVVAEEERGVLEAMLLELERLE